MRDRQKTQAEQGLLAQMPPDKLSGACRDHARRVDCLAVQRDQRSSAHQSVYRVGQLVFRLVESVFRLHRITGAGLVNRERLFFGLDPFAGGIKDRNFGLCHGPIVVVPEIGVGAVADRLVPFLHEYWKELSLIRPSLFRLRFTLDNIFYQ